MLPKSLIITKTAQMRAKFKIIQLNHLNPVFLNLLHLLSNLSNLCLSYAFEDAFLLAQYSLDLIVFLARKKLKI